MLGGRTNHWGRISLRFGPDDFRRYSLDGLGTDWPIGYDDLKPYYDRVDRLVGVFGSPEGRPNDPDGLFLPPPRPRCYELLVKRACDRLGVACIPARLSVLTRQLDGRPACHYCGQCHRGCRTNSNFSSPGVLLAPARRTGRLTILTGAMAREVTIDRSGRAAGVAFVRKANGQDELVRARVVVLAASACESARLLLNSRSSLFPDGLGNSSGAVGKYLTDTTGAEVGGFIPALVDHIPHNEDGVGGVHIYMPWWLDNRKLDFPRGYHIEVYGGLNVPAYGFGAGIEKYPSGGGYGRRLKHDYRRYYGASVDLAGRGEMVPNEACYCDLDPEIVDRWGIPVLRFHWKWSDHELRQAQAHAGDLPVASSGEMGGEALDPMPGVGRGLRHRRRSG